MTTICFVRHGQTDWNYNRIIQGREDIPLNHTGIQQAEESALYLANESWDRVIASPLGRAVHTAEIIANKVGLKVVSTDARLVERCFGDASGKPIDEYLARKTNGEDIPDMETDAEISERMMEAVHEIATKYPEERIIIVAHSHAIKGALSSMDESISFQSPLANACASYVTFCHEKKIFHVNEWNVHEHIITKE
ncbi:MAG: histidine phosphatase family protein [Bacilli bacterium]